MGAGKNTSTAAEDNWGSTIIYNTLTLREMMTNMAMDETDIAIPGFRANGVACGIKGNGKRDLAVIFSETPALAAGVFTTNRFKAAPVLHDIKKIEKGTAQAIIANSGNANAATGSQGEADATVMARAAAGRLNIDERFVLVASTGIIGKKLPIEKIETALPALVQGLDEQGIARAEEAIMTTDRFPKIEYRRVTIAGKDIRICGIAKGAGMIEPNMATMLAFIMTDAALETAAIKKMFTEAITHSFNAITVDGCMSTNDTAILLANGYAGNSPIALSSPECSLFNDVLKDVMISLAKSIVRDGEGATKVIEIRVSGARTELEAKRVAYAIARSNLVKTAFFGCDPNWGRIISAIGVLDLPIPTDRVELLFEGVSLFRGGMGVPGNERIIDDIMKKADISVEVKLAMGGAFFRVFASDLSHEYVDINALYHT